MKKSILFILIAVILSAFALSASAENALLLEDNCETGANNVTVMEGSWDGTKYYHCDNGADLGFLPYETSSDFLYELDIRFNVEGGGFSFMKSGKWNSCIRVKDGNFALQTGGNNFTKYVPVDLTKWYHITFLGRTNRDANQVTYGHIILEEYDENGQRINAQVFRNVNLRNNAATHFINVIAGSDIDNIKAYTLAPTKLELTSDAESVVSGGSVQFTLSSFYNELEMYGINTADIAFEVYDENNEYLLEDENIKIDPNGKLTTDPLTASQNVTVRVTSKASGLSAEKQLKIMTGDIFTVTGVGVSEKGDKVTQVAVNKNFAAYKDTVTFVVAFYNPDGSFKCIDFKSISGKNLSEGENKVNVNIAVPSGFDVFNQKMNIFVVTTLTGISTESIKITKNEMPVFDGAVTVISVKDDADITKLKSEDVLYFDVIYPDGGNIVLPDAGKTYMMGSVNKLDTLFEITE